MSDSDLAHSFDANIFTSVFPTRFRASAHGISAAAGKAGAIISALAFNSLSKDIGTPAVLWSKHPPALLPEVILTMGL